ncbi:phage holin family protein [Clostridium sp. Marseille-QA1073]
MEFKDFIVEQALILIPVLYIIGIFLKQSNAVKDEIIPLVLLSLGILSSNLLLGFGIQSIIQGVLVTGTTVLTNQVVKQADKTGGGRLSK